MASDLLAPVASLEELEGSAGFLPSQPPSRDFRHEQLNTSAAYLANVLQAVRPSHPSLGNRSPAGEHSPPHPFRCAFRRYYPEETLLR